jgi:hypothetical protein
VIGVGVAQSSRRVGPVVRRGPRQEPEPALARHVKIPVSANRQATCDAIGTDERGTASERTGSGASGGASTSPPAVVVNASSMGWAW